MTTSSIRSAPAPTSATASRPSRSKVEHFYWFEDGQVAYDLGVQVRSCCGKSWFFLRSRPDDRHLIAGSTVKVQDCKLCVRVSFAGHR